MLLEKAVTKADRKTFRVLRKAIRKGAWIIEREDARRVLFMCAKMEGYAKALKRCQQRQS